MLARFKRKPRRIQPMTDQDWWTWEEIRRRREREQALAAFGREAR